MSKPKKDECLLRIDSLCVKYFAPPGQRDLTVVREMSLKIRHGEVFAITGQSGAGKSTLGLAIMGLLDENPRVVSGEIHFDGVRVDSLTAARAGGAFMVFQESRASLNPYIEVGKQVDECLKMRHPAMRQTEMRERRSALLNSVGISPDRANSLPGELSSGQCQRVMIAMALALETKLLVGDEPLSRLDFRVGEQLTDLLCKLKEEEHLGMLLLTHDMYLIRRLADRVAFIYGGEFVEEGPCNMLMGSGEGPLHPYARDLCNAYDSFDIGRLSNMEPSSTGCVYAANCRIRTDRCRKMQPEFIQITKEHKVRCLSVQEK